MLFNSYEFIFVFLPVTLAAFFALGYWSRTAALRWLILASLAFYAWWRPLNVLIIAPSVAINFGLARALERLGAQGRPRMARAVLALGIAFNVAFLGYFKYANFFVGVVNDVFGSQYFLTRIVLPLGISFITFQKIGFLVDVHSRRIERFSLQDYCLFVLFFPQLIAGPIVHYREMMPQFHKVSCRPEWENLALGLTLFVIGLCKKVILADGISTFVTPIYQQAATGTEMTLLSSWMAAVGFTFQIYFDFSGYTDMALGLARAIGVRLPPNFNSPLKATSIIDFWLRWHMTLTRFLTAYIYNPLALKLTRRRMASGRAVFAGRTTTLGAFLELLMFPTLLTMLVSGLWHGAGYLFIVWGLVHGIYLTVNHVWRRFGPRLWPDRATYDRVMTPAGRVLTFVSVAAAMVIFQSTTVHGAIDLLRGMAGLNGMALPGTLVDHLGPLAEVLRRLGITRGLEPGVAFLPLAIWLAVLGAIAFGAPNTLQILGRYEPALGVTSEPGSPGFGGRAIHWSPSLPWAIGASAVLGACVAIMAGGGQSPFLYFQF